MKMYKKIKNLVFTLCLLCGCLLLFSMNAKAETGTGTIKGTNVNVRSAAGTTAAKVATVSKGDVVIVIGSAGDATGKKWYQVRFTKNGKEYTGYIIENYVNYTKTQESNQASGGNESGGGAQTGSGSSSEWKGKVVGTNVNVRQSAVSGAVIGSVSTNTRVTVSRTEKGSDGKNWYYISVKINGSAKKGWIRSDFVKKDDSAQTPDGSSASSQGENSQTPSPAKKGTIKGNNVRVRQQAVNGAVVCQLMNGAALTIEGQVTGSDNMVWYKVSFVYGGANKSGYVRSDFVTLQETPENEPEEEQELTTQQMGDASGSLKGIMKGNNVRVRQKPVDGAVICQLMTGAELTILGGEVAGDNKEWYKVTFTYNGSEKTGYVRGDFVTTRENVPPESSQPEENDGESDSSEKKGAIQGDYVRIRKKPVNGAVICQLMTGAELVIDGEETGSDNKIWYKVSFVYNGSEKSGYVRSDFVKVTENGQEDGAESEIPTDGDFEAYLDSQGFPESYKDQLRSLHNAHPKWTFRAVATNLKWEDVIAAESKVGTNLVTKNAVSSWKSTETTAYNWKKNSWYTFDGGAWVAASKEIVQYYMDPRNFLTEKAIFQFESLEYESYQNAEGVSRLLAGSFMKGNFKEPDGTKKSYAKTFVKIGKEVGVNPYHLAARCYQEQGAGNSGSISGKVKGYENIFNYYNIGAYAANGNSPVVQGLIYASKSTDSSATNYERPWNTRYKSLLGGSRYVAQKYVKAGQNTLYFQKFNVVNTRNGLYRHQYMTNLQAAESEAVKMSKAYTEENEELVFYIPVYKGMPEKACAKPTGNQNPNNYLATLEVAGQQLTPVFDPATTTYDLTVDKNVKKAEIKATAVAATSDVSGTGSVKLSRGANKFNITCKAESGAEKVYTINIVRK